MGFYIELFYNVELHSEECNFRNMFLSHLLYRFSMIMCEH